MSGINIGKVNAIPSTVTRDGLYFTRNDSGGVDIHLRSAISGSLRTIKGFTETDLQTIARHTKIEELPSQMTGMVQVGDSARDSVSKLKNQFDDFSRSEKGQSIFSAFPFTTVPTTFRAPYILVLQPHLRMMVWNGARYIRAPWHRPGLVEMIYTNPPSMEGYLPIRSDVVYQQENYPDLAEYLGLSGSGTFSLVETRGEFLRVLDNGRGIDVNRALRSPQHGTLIGGGFDDNEEMTTPGALGYKNTKSWNGDEFILSEHGDMTAAYRQTPVFSKSVTLYPASYGGAFYSVARPRNISLTSWISY